MSEISLLLFLSDTSLKDQVYCTILSRFFVIKLLSSPLIQSCMLGFSPTALFSGSNSGFLRDVFVHKLLINITKKNLFRCEITQQKKIEKRSKVKSSISSSVTIVISVHMYNQAFLSECETKAFSTWKVSGPSF